MSILLRFYLLGLALVALLALRAFVSKDRTTLVRCGTLLILLTVLVLVIAAGKWAIAILCGVFTVLAFNELGNLRPSSRKVIAGIGWSVALALFAILFIPIPAISAVICAVSLLAFSFVFFSLRKATTISMPVFSAIAMHIVCGLAAILLLGLAGNNQLITLIFLLQFNDGFAYLTGRLWGKTKLAPVISPNKSIEGAIGGLCATAIAAFVMRTDLLPVFAGYSWAHAGGLVAMVVVLGIGGDLMYSLIKRRAGLKDFASILPGHGGILDRIDSVLAVFPLALVWNIWLR